jgi:hypothetical protein
MSMHSRRQVAIATALVSALCATPPLPASGTDQPRVWTGLSCSSATREEDRLLVSSIPHGEKTTCVDRGAVHIDYRKDALGILPYRAGITALKNALRVPATSQFFLSASTGPASDPGGGRQRDRDLPC